MTEIEEYDSYEILSQALAQEANEICLARNTYSGLMVKLPGSKTMGHRAAVLFLLLMVGADDTRAYTVYSAKFQTTGSGALHCALMVPPEVGGTLYDPIDDQCELLDNAWFGNKSYDGRIYAEKTENHVKLYPPTLNGTTDFPLLAPGGFGVGKSVRLQYTTCGASTSCSQHIKFAYSSERMDFSIYQETGRVLVSRSHPDTGMQAAAPPYTFAPSTETELVFEARQQYWMVHKDGQEYGTYPYLRALPDEQTTLTLDMDHCLIHDIMYYVI